MLFRFVERTDTGVTTVATADVKKTTTTWKGSKVRAMRSLLSNTKWRLLGERIFDEKNKNHWKILPKLLTGSRLWVESDRNG